SAADMSANACKVDSDGGVEATGSGGGCGPPSGVDGLFDIVVSLLLLRSLQDVSEVGWPGVSHRGVVVTLDAVRRHVGDHSLDISLESSVGEEVRRRRSEWITRRR